ncbi:hypothetical protein [Halobellus inordinatus]|uniref:hypothetical protein n=1 Tax=Halobellus inordinatus TaxID=1126236 RepID=UPI00211430FF|nr:hypothetical protein [Halobellus ramosii]
MLGRVVEQAREQEMFSREDTPTELRVEAAFLYHAGLSYRRVKKVIGRSYEAGASGITNWRTCSIPTLITTRRLQSMKRS